MDELLAQYLIENVSPELALVVTKAHQLMMDFDPNYETTTYINIASLASESDPEEVKQSLLGQTRLDSLAITTSHGITVNDEITLQDINLINRGLYDLQYLENYLNIPDLLLTDLSNEEKMFYILETVTGVDNEHFGELIEVVEDRAIDSLVLFINERLSLMSVGVKDQDTLVTRSIALIKRLQDKAEWDSLLGVEVIEAGVEIGFPFDLYIDYVNHYFQVNPPTSVDFIATNLLSVIYLTKQGVVDPLALFNDIKALLFDDTETQNQIAAKIMYLHET